MGWGRIGGIKQLEAMLLDGQAIRKIMVEEKIMSQRLPNGRFQRINELYAFISIDENGDEGLMAFFSIGTWMPMVGADLDNVKSLREIANKSGQKYEIRKFKQETQK